MPRINGALQGSEESMDSTPLTPRELHSAAFGEKSRMDVERLSLAQQSLLARQSSQIENALLKRATLARQIQQTLSSSAAAQKLLEIDPASKSFSKQVSGIIADHPEALASTGFQKLLQDRRSDRANYVKAATPEILSNPYAAKTFDAAYENSGSPEMAASAAKSQLELFGKATKLASSPHLSPDEVSKFYNPQTGQFNLDPVSITQSQIKHDTAEAAQKQQMEQFKLVEQADKAGVKIPAAAVVTNPAAPATPQWKTLADKYLPTAAPAAVPAPSQTPAPAPSASPTPAPVIAEGVPGGDELAAAEEKARAQ